MHRMTLLIKGNLCSGVNEGTSSTLFFNIKMGSKLMQLLDTVVGEREYFKKNLRNIFSLTLVNTLPLNGGL